jgi:hypothetical protein
MSVVLKAEKIIKYFYDPEKFQVLKGVDFEVQKGELHYSISFLLWILIMRAY